MWYRLLFRVMMFLYLGTRLIMCNITDTQFYTIIIPVLIMDIISSNLDKKVDKENK